MAMRIVRRAAILLHADLFPVAPDKLPSYRKPFMGQQLRKMVKRRRRISYLERKKAKAKAAAPAKRETPKPKAAKKAASAKTAAAARASLLPA